MDSHSWYYIQSRNIYVYRHERHHQYVYIRMSVYIWFCRIFSSVCVYYKVKAHTTDHAHFLEYTHFTFIFFVLVYQTSQSRFMEYLDSSILASRELSHACMLCVCSQYIHCVCWFSMLV